MLSSAAEEDNRHVFVEGLSTDKVLPRLEIDDFCLDKDVLNLFLIALSELQKKPIDDPLSWFQIAGIHGQPFTDWNNVGPKPLTDRGAAAGYCSHSSVTFPTWHRPYVAMMEQAVYGEMVLVARAFDDDSTKQKYINACSRFRFPYWDPCLPRELIDTSSEIHSSSERHLQEFGVPKIVSTRQVYLIRPERPDELVPENNPLYQYDFPEIPEDSDLPKELRSFWNHESGNALFNNPSLGGTRHTVRAPDQRGHTDDSYINAYLSTHIQREIGSSLYKVLTVQQSWNGFSNDVFDQNDAREAQKRGVNYVDHTVEGFHDNIHVFLGQGRLRGGSGHIGNPEYAAFDPIFWLHHCNIDRITALWQAKRGTRDSESWWEQQAAGEQSWAVDRGAVQTPSDDLKPFRSPPKSERPFWRSNDVRDWAVLGYTYHGKHVIRNPSSGKNELVPFDISLENTDSANLNSFFNQFYSWMDIPSAGYPDFLKQFYPIPLGQVEALTGRPGPDRPHIIRDHPSRLDGHPLPDPRAPDYSYIPVNLRHNNRLRQWDIHIVAEKFRFEGSYQVFLFLGPFNPDDPDNWPSEENLIGIDGIFSNNPKSGGCANCEEQAEARLSVMDVIALTPHLIKWIRSEEKCPRGDPDGCVLKNLEREQVGKFLKKNFHWRVADMNLKVIEDVECVRVSAVDRIINLPETYDQEVEFGEHHIHEGVAHGDYGDGGQGGGGGGRGGGDIEVGYVHRHDGKSYDGEGGEGKYGGKQEEGGDYGKEQHKKTEGYSGNEGNGGYEGQEGGGGEGEDEGRKCCGLRCSLM